MEKSPQVAIEKFMNQIVGMGNYEMAFLFSEEGLPMAEVCGQETIPEDRLVEMSLLFQEVMKMADVIGGISQVREIVIEGSNRRKIIFRFFQAFHQNLILSLVIPPRKTYKGLTNKLMKLVEKVSE
ncbi:hypothetical protein JW960_17220 [candidate division KSB1 bacterium]|nr:hypothetical protein [candidate division KSB1 bacterium]